MSFTGLHRALGVNPGPLSSEMVDQAVAAGVSETDDLDWKRELPPERNLTQTDFPKDVAAMANAGGGVIVYGIEEVAKAATRRLDVGSLSETHARALCSAAVTGISPPVFGLDVIELGEQGSRVVAVVTPASVDVPHLIYRGEHFGAPVRNDADTVWMLNARSSRCTAPDSQNNATRTRRSRRCTGTRSQEEISATGPGLSAWPATCPRSHPAASEQT